MFTVNQEADFQGKASNTIDSTLVEANKGIFMNCQLKKVAFEPFKEGSNSGLSFYFEDSNGNKFRHFEWLLDTTREDFNAKFDSFNSRVGHILTKFGVSEAQCKANAGSTIEEFFENYSKLPIDYSQRVNLKIVLNDKGYACFTKYVGFIEKYEEGKVSSLRVGKKELITAPKADSNPNDIGASAFPESVL